MRISSRRRARLSLKEAFRVIFARPASLPRLSFADHSLFQLHSPRSSLVSLPFSLCLFPFRFGLRVRSCDATMLPISSSRDHLLPRPLSGPGAIRTSKSFHRESYIHQFLGLVSTRRSNPLIPSCIISYFVEDNFLRREVKRFLNVSCNIKFVFIL